MTIHEKIYRKCFDLLPEETILSEISGKVASEIHHLYPKMMGGRKTFQHEGVTYDIECIDNYIALTRKEHEDAHANKYTKEELWNIHQDTMHFV